MSKSQNERLLEWMRHSAVDPMIALNVLGIFRLAARVRDLKDEGHNIIKHTASVRNRFDEPCSVARYELVA